MNRLKADASACQARSFSVFKRLVRADSVLFHLAGLLRDLGLEESARSIEEQRANLAARLEPHLDAAYAQMTSSIRSGDLQGPRVSSV